MRKDALLVVVAPLAATTFLFFSPSHSTGGGC